MSGELNLKYSATGKTILALILGQNRTTCWNGTAMVSISTVADANWATGMITMTEQITQNSTPTAIYIGNFPSAITAPGDYVVEYYVSTAATPGSPAIGTQDIWWNGTKQASPGEITAQSTLTVTSESLLVDGAYLFRGFFNERPSYECQLAGAYLWWDKTGYKWHISTNDPLINPTTVGTWVRDGDSPIGSYEHDTNGNATVAGVYSEVGTIQDHVYGGARAAGRLPYDPASNTQVNTRLAAASYTAPPSTESIASAVWNAATRSLTTFGTLAADIWAYATRTITGGTISTYTGNTPQSGDAYSRLGAPAGDCVSADIAAVKSKTDNLPANPAAVGSAMTLTSAYDAAKTAAQAGDAMTLQTAERQAIAAALLDLANAVDGKTLRQAMQIISAVLAGKVSGAGSGTETFRGLDDAQNRVVVTADALGNRTNVTYP